MLKDLLNGSLLLHGLLVLKALATRASLLLLVLEGLLGELDILQPQLVADDVEITGRVDVTLDVDNLGIVEATNDLEDGIDGANVRQEGVTETGTSGGTSRQTSDIVHRKVGRHARLWVVLFAKPIIALIGYDDTCLLRVDGGVGEVGRVSQVALGNGLEEGGLSNVCKANLKRREGGSA